MNDSDDRYTRITLRIPRVLHNALQSAADLHSHSMNAEIIKGLQDALAIKKDIEALLEANRLRSSTHAAWLKYIQDLQFAVSVEDEDALERLRLDMRDARTVFYDLLSKLAGYCT